jgi:ADP-heptose:LPS heptosyltransferase
MRILALVPGGIEQQFLFFPTLDSLKAAYPAAQIDVAIQPAVKDAYRIAKSVKETLLFDFAGRKSLSDWGNLLGTIRDREYELALCADPSWLMGATLWMTGIPTRIGYQGAADRLYTQTVPRQVNQPFTTQYHDLVAGLGLSQARPATAVSVPTPDLAWADGERQRLGLDRGGYVLVQVGAYPVNYWQIVLEDVQKKQPTLPIVLLKDFKDKAGAADVANLAASMSTLKVTSPSNYGQTVAMIAGSSLMLCTEGPTLQLGIATEAFTVALLGTGKAEQLMPESDRLVGIKSPTGKLADIVPQSILDRVWQG